MVDSKNPIIVGIDPGTTTGLAILDLRGEVIKLRSGKNLGKDQLVHLISKHGNPVIVTTDVAKPPQITHRISAAFSAKLFLPEKNMKVEDKREMTKRYDYGNDHERDSLASVLHAHRAHRDLIERLHRRASHLDKFDEIAALILTGKVNRISDAIDAVYPPEKPKNYGLRRQPRRKPRLVKRSLQFNFSFNTRTKPLQASRPKFEIKERVQPFSKDRFKEWLRKYKQKKVR